jgi:chromosome segregation ATPase
MTGNARGEVPEEVDGLTTAEAVDRILERDDSLERDAVRERIEYVTHGGTVCRQGIEDGLSEVSEIIEAPQDRIDRARKEFGTAAEIARPVADIRIVGSRLEAFEERLLALKDEVDRLGPELNELFNEWLGEPDDIYAMADGLHQHADRGERIQRLIDELIGELESFQQWAQADDARFEELEHDIEGVDESLVDLGEALAELEDTDGSGPAGAGTDGDAEIEDGDAEAEGIDDAGPKRPDEPEPVFVWVDAALRHRLVGLLISDLEAELDGLRTWAEREATGSEERADAAAERIAEIRSRWETIEERIEAVARPAWRERFADRIAAFESDLDAFDPPIDWGEVQRALQEHQAKIGREMTDDQ